MNELVAAIDQGTTSTRCMIFDRTGSVVASAAAEHRQIYPRPGWVEHDPIEIWDATQRVIREATSQCGARPGRGHGQKKATLVAVGLTNQRETTLFWDRRTGEPFANAIVWQDTRTKTVCDELGAQGGPDRYRDRTGLPLATYFSGPKIRWALDHVDGLRAAADRGHAVCGTIDSWLVWNLNGGQTHRAKARFVTDVTNASRTLLLNLGTLDWDNEILHDLGIPRAMLPGIVSSSDRDAYGSTSPEGPFASEIPICAAVGDQQAAMLGQGCFDIGDVKNTYGTGCFMLLNTGSKPVASKCGLLTTVAYRLGDRPAVFALEGSVAIAGALVQWLRDNLGLIERADQIETLARSVDDSAGIYIVPAFSGLFAPHWRSDARGVIVGLTRFVTKAHLARAALEATCYQSRDVLDAMRKDAGVEPRTLKVDGGMVANDLLMQFQADILGPGIPVVRPRVPETTALGAAYAAGLAVGFWDSLDALRNNWEADRTWEAKIDEATRQRLYAGWLKALDRSLNWVT